MRPGHPYLAGAPLFIAHRGGAGLAPENTMAAFRRAVEVWDVDMLEMDVHATRDGRIVVIHDATVDRTTDGAGAVADLPWDRVRELDAGSRFLDPEGRATFRGTGVGIPLFEEVLEAFPRMRINVETKTGAAARGLVEVIRRHDAVHRVLVAVTEEAARASIHDYEGPRGASRQQIRRFWLLRRVPLLGRLYTPRADALQVPPFWEGREVVTPAFVRAAHARNLPVHVWTVDDAEEMRRLLDLGVDGIQTDRPDRLARVLVEARGRPRPPGLRETSPPDPPGLREMGPPDPSGAR